MRGKVQAARMCKWACGITPAYAGKSSFLISVIVIFLGSPPPMRGKATTPATRNLELTDHPRLCGEKEIVFLESRLTEGSPPPMRGKVHKAVSVNDSTGITPAYAGKRWGGGEERNQKKDHPRLCGEKLFSI